ncbi:uncharacterized protein BDW70DRAFT_162942 [Aspergillus foveolatus]|uniref:uncharacterized protein n=1 Tax=Aspergillus foveolatus TaxID=210207 RepID=UPI003CCCB557
MTETTPLLRDAGQSPDSSGPTRLIHRRSAVIVLIAIILFIIDLGASIELAAVNGWKDTLDMIPGIVLGTSYGFMADQTGRWPVLILSMGDCSCPDQPVSLVFLMISYLEVFLTGCSIGSIGGNVTTALGAGSELAARNLLMAVVEPEILGLACSAIPLVQSIASLASMPMLVATFRWGIHQGNGWMGAPFLIASVQCALANVALMTVQV